MSAYVTLPKQDWVNALDAVRAKTGTSELIKSGQLAGKINSISGGGGGVDTSVEDGFVTRMLSPTTYTNDRVTTIGPGIFMGCWDLTEVNLPQVTEVYPYAFCWSGLTSIELPQCENIGPDAFLECENLTSIDLPKCTSIEPRGFCGCYNLTSINLPLCESIGDEAFASCGLTTVSFPQCTFISDSAFSGCEQLSEIYLMSPSICTLTNTNAFQYTGIWSDKGNIYVPYSLYNDYIASSEWSFFANRISVYPPK